MTGMDLLLALGQVDEDLLSPVLKDEPKKSVRRTLRTVILIAAILALLATAALAAGGGLLKLLFPERYDIIEDYVLAKTAAAENELVRLTAESAVTDGYTSYVIFSVERLDGGLLEDMTPDAIITPRCGYGGRNYGGAAIEPLITGAETDSKRWFCWKATGRQNVTGAELRLLGLKNRQTGEALDIGELKLELELTACPVKLGRRGGDPDGKELYPFIVLSPLSLNIEAYANLNGMPPADEPVEDRVLSGGLSGCNILLRMRGGTEQDLTDIACRHPNITTNLITVSFDKLLDINLAEAVVIDGIEYSLTYGDAPLARTGGDRDMPAQESTRAYVYGGHTPAHPKLSADGSGVSLTLDGVWSDGYTTELMLRIEAEEPKEAYTLPPHLGGALTFKAESADGKLLAVGVLPGGSAQGLPGFIVEAGGRAASLTIGLEDAELTIPLDMKRLQELPQTAPKEAAPQITSGSDIKLDLYQSIYDELFTGLSPDAAGYQGDNGDYRITLQYVYLEAHGGTGRLRVIALAERSDGGYFGKQAVREFQCLCLTGDEELDLSGSFSSGSWSGDEEDRRYYKLDFNFNGDFQQPDAIRLIWTPPDGDYVTIDIPVS